MSGDILLTGCLQLYLQPTNADIKVVKLKIRNEKKKLNGYDKITDRIKM